MRITPMLFLPLLLAACGESNAPKAVGNGPGVLVVDHFFEVPRNPAPGYQRDGAIVQAVNTNSHAPPSKPAAKAPFLLCRKAFKRP